MINRWQGNSGRVQRWPEPTERPEKVKSPPPLQSLRPAGAQAMPAKKSGGLFSGLESLQRLLPGKAEALETEDIILMLILYLMYRESGDTELLMIMGAMFLL